MKSLKLRNIFFEPDERGNGKIKDTQKGPEDIAVSRDEIKAKIQNGEPTVEITAYDNEREKEEIEK